MLHSITWSGNILYLLFLPLSTSKHGCTTVIHKLRILVAQDQFHFMIMTPVLCELMVLMCSWNRECMEILFQALSAQTLREAALYRRNSLMEVKAVASMMGPHNLDSTRKAQIFLEVTGYSLLITSMTHWASDLAPYSHPGRLPWFKTESQIVPLTLVTSVLASL